MFQYYHPRTPLTKGIQIVYDYQLAAGIVPPLSEIADRLRERSQAL
jgi:hypothetical protein